MMKSMYALLSVFVIGCATSAYDITIEESGARIVIGEFDRSLFQADSAMKIWFQSRYNQYTVDTALLPVISSLSHDIHFVLLVGTWCGDSKREIPRLYKIFDAALITDQQVTMHGFDRSKNGRDGISEQFALQRVPTIILVRGGKEIGRIVEMPKETLEYDLAEILKKK